MRAEEIMLQRLQILGAPMLESVRFKSNRRTYISRSSDHKRLNLHVCFRDAPEEVICAVADYAHGRLCPSHRYQAACETMRAWVRGGGRKAFLEAGQKKAGKRRKRRNRPADKPPACVGTPAQQRLLRDLYAYFNGLYFDGVLPEELPLRFSSRMKRRFGHCGYVEHKNGQLGLREIALNVDLLLEGNEEQLRDTLLHEMAHAYATLVHKEGGHGPRWKAVCRRIGVEDRACTKERILQRKSRTQRPAHVPSLEAIVRARPVRQPVAARGGPAPRPPVQQALFD